MNVKGQKISFFESLIKYWFDIEEQGLCFSLILLFVSSYDYLLHKDRHTRYSQLKGLYEF